MKDLLQPFHFKTPERPKEEDFSIDDPESYDEAIQEWERLYGDND